jgi:hypothetical protein
MHICFNLHSKRTTHSQIALCSPSIIISFMSTVLTPSMRTTIQEMGFGWILWLAAKSLDNREFLSWLMDRFDLEDMIIQIGAKQIRVTKYSVRCVFGLPSERGDHPMITDDAWKKILRDVAARLFHDQPSPKVSRSTLTERRRWLTSSTTQDGPTWMKIYASESFSWRWTTIFSHPTLIVTSGPLTHFGVATWGLLLVIIGAK